MPHLAADICHQVTDFKSDMSRQGISNIIILQRSMKHPTQNYEIQERLLEFKFNLFIK